MTKKFDDFVKNILKECDGGMGVASVLGNAGSYDTSDPRNPTVLGPMQRRLKLKKKKKAKK